MGVVYAATDERLGRVVAVKLVKTLGGDPDAQRRFELEARVLARVRHPNIVTIHDVGTIGREMAFLVMEFLNGSPLRHQMRRRGATLPPEVATWLAPVLGAMSFAHAAGVIHRDLKPENIFLADEHGRVTPKVLDFGVAKLSGPDIVTLTMTEPGRVVGTLAYMAPEQFEGRLIDARADVFALGVSVIEGVTGINPFQQLDPAATIAAVLQRPAHVTGDGEGVGALDHALQRCIAKRADDRYPDIESMRAAVVPALLACNVTLRARV
jgi:serine/threonine-protein kinase